eukprot:s894_g23.t1
MPSIYIKKYVQGNLIILRKQRWDCLLLSSDKLLDYMFVLLTMTPTGLVMNRNPSMNGTLPIAVVLSLDVLMLIRCPKWPCASPGLLVPILNRWCSPHVPVLGKWCILRLINQLTLFVVPMNPCLLLLDLLLRLRVLLEITFYPEDMAFI